MCERGKRKSFVKEESGRVLRERKGKERQIWEEGDNGYVDCRVFG